MNNFEDYNGTPCIYIYTLLCISLGYQIILRPALLFQSSLSLSLLFSFFFSFYPSTSLSVYSSISICFSPSFYQPAYISLFPFIHLSVRFDDQLYAPIIEVIVTACSCRRRTPQMKLYGVIIVGARPLDLYDPVIHSNREPASEPDVRIGFFFLSWNCKKDSRGRNGWWIAR